MCLVSDACTVLYSAHHNKVAAADRTPHGCTPRPVPNPISYILYSVLSYVHTSVLHSSCTPYIQVCITLPFFSNFTGFTTSAPSPNFKDVCPLLQTKSLGPPPSLAKGRGIFARVMCYVGSRMIDYSSHLRVIRVVMEKGKTVWIVLIVWLHNNVY